MQLTDIKEYKGTIELLSGLHIGAGDTEMHIGGADSSVIKNALNGRPYIPGSSLKGKIRSLLEMKCAKILETKGETLGVNQFGGDDKNANIIIQLFGAGANGASEEIGPTRLIFSDCQMLVDDNEDVIFEVKAENHINRLTGTAEDPRFIERVVAGVKFEFSISMKVFKDDDEKSFEEKLLEGLALLEKDALGASGSRGYSKVKFTFDDEELNDKLNANR